MGWADKMGHYICARQRHSSGSLGRRQQWEASILPCGHLQRRVGQCWWQLSPLQSSLLRVAAPRSLQGCVVLDAELAWAGCESTRRRAGHSLCPGERRVLSGILTKGVWWPCRGRSEALACSGVDESQC